MKFFLQLLFLVLCSSVHAEVTYLFGDFSGKNLALHMEIRVDQRNYNGITKSQEIELNGQEAFSASFRMEQAQYIKLVYARNELKVFAEPGDSIFITIDPENFTYNSTLSGNNGNKNTLLNHYYKNNDSAQRRSDRLQFRYGDFWYYTNTTVDGWMRSMDGQSFLLKMASRKEQWLDYLLENEKKYPSAFSNSFRDYFYSEIQYDWAYFMLIYGTTYHHRHSLPEDYLSFLSSVSISDGNLASPRYQRYLSAYMNYIYRRDTPSETQSFSQQYTFAKERLELPEESFYLSEILIKQLKNKQEPEFMDQYYDFINSNTMVAYSERLSRKFNHLIFLSTGSEAPDFTLTDAEGNRRSKDDFLGKPIVINFWASWCKPCVAKFPDLQKVHDEFKDKMHLVCINLDRSQESFHKALEQWDPPGVQLFATSAEEQKKVMDSYGIKFLPGMLLLDEQGRFLITPDAFDLEQIPEYFQKQ